MLNIRSIIFSFICLSISCSLSFAAEKKKTVTIKDLFKSTDNTVVTITAGGNKQGSGVAVKNGNLLTEGATGTIIVTNAHVVGTSKKISIKTSKKTDLVGTVVAVDKASDLALVQIEGLELPVASLAQSEVKLDVGDIVFTVGSPKG